MTTRAHSLTTTYSDPTFNAPDLKTDVASGYAIVVGYLCSWPYSDMDALSRVMSGS